MFADGTAEARVAARYANFDPKEMHRMQVERNNRREDARNRNAAPQTPATAVRVNVATPKAIDYLVSLSAAKTPHVTESAIRDWAAGVDRHVVSEKIDELKTMGYSVRNAPRPASLERHGVPAGRYAVDGAEGQTVFVRVDRPTEGQWAGRIFVKIQAGDELIRTARSVADALLGKIAAAGVQEAMLRYGREIGACGHCGRTLTNKESREAGIGPHCRSKLGW